MNGDGALTEANYSERLNVGYRCYDAHAVEPMYPFGHGISFAEFQYSDLRISGASTDTDKTTASAVVTVSLQLTNNATVAGAEVVQVYLGFPPAADEPPKQLKGFKKVAVSAGGSVAVSIDLTDKEFSIWSVSARGWAPVKGHFQVMVGSSSRDIRLVGQIQR